MLGFYLQTSRDLMCFIQFENMNIYYGSQHKVKYKAPTDHCFVLKVMYKKNKFCKGHTQIIANSEVLKFQAPRSLTRLKQPCDFAEGILFFISSSIGNMSLQSSEL